MSAPPAISIITPSYRREALLRHQHQMLLRQSEQDFEWLILDDSPEPSAYFPGLDDGRIHYRHHAGPRLAIGTKRNLLADMARAPVIAHFDDDDYYAPDYLATMLGRIAAGPDITKLSGWFVYHVVQRALGYWDTVRVSGMHLRFARDPVVPMLLPPETARAFAINHAGYGFSYVYRKAVWARTPFADVDFNEDYRFILAAIAAGARFEHRADSEGLCLHILGRDNMSACYPQYLLPDFMLARLFPHAAPLLER